MFPVFLLVFELRVYPLTLYLVFNVAQDDIVTDSFGTEEVIDRSAPSRRHHDVHGLRWATFGANLSR